MRSVCSLMFLLVFLTCDTALAIRHGRCCRRQVSCCCSTAKPTYGPNFCLRDIYMEFPGPPHLYTCLVYETGCGSSEEPYLDLWFGYPSISSPPQACPDCESEGWGKGGGRPPGHGHPFKNKGRACKWIKDYYPDGAAPAPCNYYELTVNGRTYCFVMLEAHDSQPGARRYFGVETRKLAGEGQGSLSSISKDKVRGKVLSFEGTIEGNTGCKALVWLE